MKHSLHLLPILFGVFVAAANGDEKIEIPEDELEIIAIESSRQFREPPTLPFSRRRLRRQSGDDENLFVYDGDFEDEGKGPWGEWQPSNGGQCSRTCGGGVLVDVRECEGDDDVDACKGPTKRFSSCNVTPCRRGSRDFREEQCAAFNRVAFEGKFYDWIPYLKAPRKCELNCMPRGERFYYRHAKKVEDGTACYDDDVKDGVGRVCVNGECRSVGCDGRLGSDAAEDKCRVCGGDGSNCVTETGLYTDEVRKIHKRGFLIVLFFIHV